jgi:MoxR-vWA-beta-propeller ternary system protein
MTSDLSVIRSYLVPRARSFWKWSADGDAIIGPGDRTIAFRRELELVLKRQLSTGLAPLGPIVLLLAACRDSWPEIFKELAESERLLAQLESVGQPRSPRVTALANSLHKSLENLNQVHALPGNLRTNSDAKAELVAAILESEPERTTPQLAAEIVTALDAGLAPELLQPDVEPVPTLASLFKDLRYFGAARNWLDAEALRLRLKTGLDREVLPAEVEEPLAKKVRKLLDRLNDDREFSGLVRLARNLMAVTLLPRPLDVPDEMPVGGVSDISQRGTPDRLLISELAQDDETLMLRVAMNEALYLRRETPPTNPPRSRVIVLDSGLRLWGVPRVYATAVALSLAALTETTIHISVLRADGDRLRPVNLATREGLVDHLQVLRPESHPARALADLGQHLAKIEGEVDTILITGDDVALDSDFRGELAEGNPEIAFLITVSRNGQFQLMQRTVHGTTVLREAKLDLEKLLAPTPRVSGPAPAPIPRPTAPLIDPARAADLPAILRVNPFPLRLPHALSARQSWLLHPSLAVSVTNDRRLMLWDAPSRGAIQLTDRLPARHLVWCRRTVRDGRTQFVVGDTGQPRLWLVTADLHGHDCQVADIVTTPSPAQCVCHHAGMMFVIHRREIDFVDMSSGNRLAARAVPADYRWMNSRFFCAPDGWYALSHDGSAPRFERVVSNQEFVHWRRLIAMFDVDGVQGPVGVCMGNGALFFTADRKLVPLKPSLENARWVRKIARDGRRFCMTPGPQQNRLGSETAALVDTLDQTVHWTSWSDPSPALEPGLAEIARPRNLRTHFRSVGRIGNSLILESRRGRGVCLRFSAKHDRFVLLPYPRQSPSMRPFCPLPSVAPGVGYRLSVATFPDGTRVYLDSRGLLHLKSCDRQIPEATFVLCREDAAGWCADGRMWGSSYFLGSNPGVGPPEIHETILTPFVRGCS